MVDQLSKGNRLKMKVVKGHSVNVAPKPLIWLLTVPLLIGGASRAKRDNGACDGPKGERSE